MLLRCCGINSYEHFPPQTCAFLYLWLELFIAISRAERRDAQSALLCRLGTFGANVAANRPLYTPHSKGSQRLEIRQSAAWKKRFSDRDAKLNRASNRLEKFVIWLMMLLVRFNISWSTRHAVWLPHRLVHFTDTKYDLIIKPSVTTYYYVGT